MMRLNLNDLVSDTCRTWRDLAGEKWKVLVTAEVAPEPLVVHGDLSHLQQAIENLLFNARDATFVMRNHLRDAARRDPALGPDARRQALIDAAGWRGRGEMRGWGGGGPGGG